MGGICYVQKVHLWTLNVLPVTRVDGVLVLPMSNDTGHGPIDDPSKIGLFQRMSGTVSVCGIRLRCHFYYAYKSACVPTGLMDRENAYRDKKKPAPSPPTPLTTLCKIASIASSTFSEPVPESDHLMTSHPHPRYPRNKSAAMSRCSVRRYIMLLMWTYL